ESGQTADVPPYPLCANSVLTHCSKQHSYSTTSSARASSAGGISRPSALAVLRLIASSNLVGCWTGKSPVAACAAHWTEKSPQVDVIGSPEGRALLRYRDGVAREAGRRRMR